MRTNALSGRRVLVTGASSGAGAAASVAFARRGCSVALLARSRPGLEVVAAWGGVDVVVVGAAAMAFGAFSDGRPSLLARLRWRS